MAAYCGNITRANSGNGTLPTRELEQGENNVNKKPPRGEA
jgi:hypothetical protein